MSRRERERVLLQLVRKQVISTQAELVAALERRGFAVTQATVSRDVKRLGLIKIRTPDGVSRYTVPDPLATNGAVRPSGSQSGAGATTARRAAAGRVSRVLKTSVREFVTAVDVGAALLCVRTHSGCANAVAVAIDEAGLDGVVGTLAGDDTIFVLTRTPAQRDGLREIIHELMTHSDAAPSTSG